jgi:hypothetical protein
VRFEAETNKELTFSPSFQIDTVDIDRGEEWRGVRISKNRRSSEVTAVAGK